MFFHHSTFFAKESKEGSGSISVILSGIRLVFGNAWQKIRLIFTKFNNFLSSIFKGINWLIGKLNTFKIKVPKGVPKIGGKEWGVNINPIDASRFKSPLLANGGYTKPNTPQLAMIGDNRHQGEVVAPEDNLEQLKRRSCL